jgi:hypothetical protein
MAHGGTAGLVQVVADFNLLDGFGKMVVLGYLSEA